MSAREVDFGGAHAAWAEPGKWRRGAVEIVLVAALEREVSRATRAWKATTLRVGRAERRMYYNTVDRAALVCAGTGPERAYRAAKACMEEFSPRLLVSIGFAGSCAPELAPGAVIVPARVVVPAVGDQSGSLASPSLACWGGESGAASEFPCACGTGTLLSVNAVTSSAGKRQARARYGAMALEMEAAGVARAAAEYGSEFAAIKAISDGVEEDLDFLSPFVTPDGFAMARFLAFLAVRPRLWPRVAELDRNSRLAVRALEQAVIECVGDWPGFAARHS